MTRATMNGCWVTIAEHNEGTTTSTTLNAKSIDRVSFIKDDDDDTGTTTIHTNGEEIEFATTESEHGLLIEAMATCPL